jgi:hypothetical protein
MNSVLPSYEDNAVMSAEQEARWAGDKRLFVQFYRRAVMNQFKSSQEGRPIFDEKDYVRIIIPGDKNLVVDSEATAEYRMRFAAQYDRYKKNQEQAQSGTPLEVWPQMTVGMVAELKAMNVSTVEQLADLPDQLAQRIMGSHMWRQKAQAFLEAAKGEAANSKLAMELEKRDAQIATLQNQLDQILKAQSAERAAQTPQSVAMKGK